MKNIIILTGSEMRHVFFRKAIAISEGINVLRTYCEGLEKTLRVVCENRGATINSLELKHLDLRERSENDFFYLISKLLPDRSNPIFIVKGTINDPRYIEEIINMKPDLIVAYGCSIIRGTILTAFKGRILNVHLGLSPYYRGSGTNFWPLVNGEPEYVGATFMYMDSGIDTGEIIHQIRARIYPSDSPHQIGNRLIGDMALVCAEIIRRFNELVPLKQLPVPVNAKYYRSKDFSGDSVRKLYEQFNNGLIEKYLEEKELRCTKVPILKNPVINEEAII